MAILSNGKFYGFLCSVKETGQKLANGVKEYVEDFVSGFAGHGWKIWEYVKGKWMLEIDSIRVRGQFTVFEMLISKVRAIIGAQAITQGCGKIKTAELSEDGTAYLITLEDAEMSFMEHDFIRCQEFTGSQKVYHVEIESVADGIIRVPLSEFDLDEEGIVLNPPAPGDDIVQFGNSQNKARQSAIYLHADETGQPAIDVMFDINGKNWDGKVKIRVGGDIPDSGGLKGFYCENGMIKGTDSNGHTVYCIYPDGTAEFGDNSAKFCTDKSGYIAGGAISWVWNAEKKKCVCTMKDVVLTWDNLSDEAKENLKGEPGKDGTDGKDGDPGKDGQDGVNGKDGNNGLSIVWKGDSSTPPTNPQMNWAYRDTDNGRVYIYNGTAWALMVADGNNGVDGTDGEPGTDGKDGMGVYITYHDSEEEPAKPTGNGMANGWHTDATASVIWISQKVAESADSGEWGKPINIKGEPGKDGQDANLLPWIEEWNGYATEIGEGYIVTPKLFSGTKAIDENGKVWLTGIAQGKDCLMVADGTTRTGIFALVNNEIVFELDPINRKYKFSGEVNADSGTFNGVINANSGTIGGFNISNGRIGSVITAGGGEYNGGNLSLLDDLIRVGNKDSYSLLGSNTIPASAGGIYTSTCRIVNNNVNKEYGGVNYGMMINVSGAEKNYGISSNAPILSNACISTKVATYIHWENGARENDMDLSRYSVFLLGSNGRMSLELPSESTVARMFKLSSLPVDFSLMFTLHIRPWSYDIIINNVYDWNANLINVTMVKGDTLTLLISKYDGFRYDVLNRQD